MDDKDRTIITFGEDTEPETGHNAGGYVSSESGFTMDVDIPQDVEHETHPYDDSAYSEPADRYLENYKQYTDRYQAEKISDENSSGSGSGAGSRGSVSTVGSYKAESAYQPAAGNVSSGRQSGKAGKPARNPKYVTKGALAACMILTMIVSSVLGALIGGTLSRTALPGSGNAGSSSEVAEDSGSSQPSLSDATGSELTISQIVDMNADAVVEILVSGTTQGYFGQMQPVEGAGSGVIIREDGYIVTNYHVIQGANKVQVTLHNGETYPASIVGGDNDKDIAVIKINAKGLTTAKIGDSSKVSVGDTAVAIGNPLGQLGGTATTGIISALDRNLEIEGRTLTLMQTDAAINGGNSGGGLFGSNGDLIGIVDAKSSGVGIEGLAFAIPINSVIDDINDIIENGTVTTRPVVGITIAEVSEDSARYYQLESAGVYITDVTGENAKKAGFQQEDRIVSIEGEQVTSSQQFISAVKKHKAGDTVTIVVSRSGQEIEIKTVLEEYTSAEG